LEHRASVKRFVSLQFLNLRQSGGFLGREISPSQGRYVTQTQINTDIHTWTEIRNHDPSDRSGQDISCLIPRGYVDQQILLYITKQDMCKCTLHVVRSVHLAVISERLLYNYRRSSKIYFGRITQRVMDTYNQTL
jgi:hypothetical protein